MFGGGGGLNPRKMEQMMKQMGIDVDEIDAEEVIIRTAEHDLVFTSPDVTKMDARGQETYQVIGSPEKQERGNAETGAEGAEDAGAVADTGGSDIPDADVEIVAARTGASEEEALAALEAHDGDLAAAVEELE